jgi:hypothetical protein
MSLAFPNFSRCFDPSTHAVRFWGHDRSMENLFFISVAALHAMEPAMTNDETSILSAFDKHRERVCAAAAKVYARGTRGSYDITCADV